MDRFTRLDTHALAPFLMRLSLKSGGLDWQECGWYILLPAPPLNCLKLREHTFTDIVRKALNGAIVIVSLADFDVCITRAWKCEDNFSVFHAEVTDPLTEHKCLPFCSSVIRVWVVDQGFSVGGSRV